MSARPTLLEMLRGIEGLVLLRLLSSDGPAARRGAGSVRRLTCLIDAP